MNHSLQAIPILNLLIAFIPALVVLVILFKWSLNATNALYALARMLVQLLLLGYFLSYIFASDNIWLVIAVLAVMVFSSSWIALGTIKLQRLRLYKNALWSIALGGGISLVIIIKGVLELEPWYSPETMIPLAGMIFASAMTSVSLAAERLNAEIGRCESYEQARNIAFQAALIPVINALFAVGLVSLPGMMTGQILSGVSPLIAVRYQIMVMCMLFASSGISAACFLVLVKPVFLREIQK